MYSRKAITLGIILFAVLIISPVAVSAAGNPVRGQSIYNLHCAGCHGGDGRGVIAGAPSFQAGSNTLMKPDNDLAVTIERGKGIMPGFGSVLKADQISDVIAHLRTFF